MRSRKAGVTLRTVALIDPLQGGHHEGYAALLARELIQRGLAVHVIGSARLVRCVRRAVPEVTGDVVQLYAHSEAQHYSQGRLERERLNVRFFREALRRARARGCDTAHILWLDSFVLSLLLVWLSGAGHGLRLRVTLHWLYFLRGFQARLGGRSEAGHLLMLRLLGRLGGRVMLHSPALAQVLSPRLGRSMVDVLPYPVEPPQIPPEQRVAERQAMRLRLGVPPEARVLLAFGGMRPDKGQDLALRALAQLPDRDHLLFVGRATPSDAEQLRRLASELGVTQRVHLHLEYVPDEDVERYFLASDIVLLPYRRNFAGQSGPLVIAASLGLPVLASRVGVLAETVNAYRLGALFPPEDPEALARCVASFDRSSFQPQTHRFREDHTPAAFAEAVLRSYSMGEPTTLPAGVSHPEERTGNTVSGA